MLCKRADRQFASKCNLTLSKYKGLEESDWSKESLVSV
jgi:hypothetical protein